MAWLDDITDAISDTISNPMTYVMGPYSAGASAASELSENLGDPDDDRTSTSTTSSPGITSGSFTAPKIDPAVAERAAAKVIAGNVAGLAAGSDVAKARTLGLTKAFDEYMAARHEKGIGINRTDLLARQVRALEAMEGLAGQFAEGLPDEAAARIEREQAERGIMQGLYGQTLDFATIKNLGLAEVDMARQAYAMYQGLVPASAQVGQTAVGLMAPTTNVPQMYGQQYAMEAQARLINPTTAFGIGAQQASQQAQLSWAANLSDINYQVQTWQTQMQMAQNQQAMQMAQQNAMIGAGARLVGTIGGAMIGGPAGAAAGGALASAATPSITAAQMDTAQVSQSSPIGTGFGFGANPGYGFGTTG